MLGLIYVGFCILFTPSMSENIITRFGNASLEKIREKEELKEHAQRVEHQIQLISNQRDSSQGFYMTSLLATLVLSLFLVTIKDKSEPVAAGQRR